VSFPITFNGAPCSALSVVFPVFGVGTWRAVITRDTAPPTEGGACSIAYDETSITGSVLATYELSAGVECCGVFGYRGWANLLPAKSYHSASGVRLSTVLTDLERETGERFASKPDTVIGTHWNRPAGIASRALNAVAVGWRVLPSGLTTVAVQAAPAVTTKHEIIQLDEARGVYTIGCDSPSGFLPGASFKSPMMPTAVTCGTVEHTLGEAMRVTVHAVKP
jgi:hypothetical protein